MTTEAERLQQQQADNQILFEAISLGEEAKRFCSSNLFKFICEEAEAKVIAAQNELATVNPLDTSTIIILQTEIARFAHFTKCLTELVTAGDAAYRLYQEQHVND